MKNLIWWLHWDGESIHVYVLHNFHATYNVLSRLKHNYGQLDLGSLNWFISKWSPFLVLIVLNKHVHQHNCSIMPRLLHANDPYLNQHTHHVNLNKCCIPVFVCYSLPTWSSNKARAVQNQSRTPEEAQVLQNQAWVVKDSKHYL